MDVEKPASKGHGFFGLFDWGKKSKKRLFVGSVSSSPDPKNAGDGKDVDDSTASTRSNSILEDVPSLKESSEHSCSSSVIDEEAQARRCPTVVARLMGLDSMPAASSSESNLMPSTAQQPFQANNHDDLTGRSYVGSPHKMPGSPIDRFKMEALPPRLAKRTLSVAQYKLLSPMKNPNHISSRNAADIVEAASRIMMPGVENISSYRVHDVGHTNAAHAYNPGEIIGIQQRSQKLNEALRKRDVPASFRPPSGKMDGRSRSSEGTLSSRISQSNGCAPVGPRTKVKPGNKSSNVAQAIHAQGGTRKGGRKLETHRNPENTLVERNGLNQQKDNNQMDTASSSSVLVPNNRRQNTMVTKHKVNLNLANPSRQRSDIHQINASPRKAVAASTFAGNSTQGSRKVDLQPTARANVRNNSIARAIPKPRRLQNRRIYSDTSQSSDSINSDRSQRRIRHNIVVDEQSSFSTNKKKISTEIVSFTFTSPVDKSLHGTHFPNYSVEKQFIENLNAVSTSSNTSNTKIVIDGDYLGLLLEQKLRELTSGVRSPYSNPAKGVKVHGTSTALDDTASACETSSIASTDFDRESLQSFIDGKATLPQTDLATKTKSGQSFQPVKYDHDVTDRAELEHLRLSPHSTWEASVSTETCSSSGSWSANGTRLFSSIEGAKTSDSTRFRKFLEADASSEYSDTASSITVATAEIPRSESSSSCHMDNRQEVEFIREILNASSSYLERFGDSDILDPNLLEELNGNTRLLAGEAGKGYRLRRRLLFDCVNELLSVKCAYYFSAGYGSWFMGMAVLQNLTAEEIHREMTSVKVAEEWMVDELVYREMSSPLGSWVDFKMDSHQAGSDIAAELLGSMLDEVVADLLTGSFL